MKKTTRVVLLILLATTSKALCMEFAATAGGTCGAIVGGCLGAGLGSSAMFCWSERNAHNGYHLGLFPTAAGLVVGGAAGASAGWVVGAKTVVVLEHTAALLATAANVVGRDMSQNGIRGQTAAVLTGCVAGGVLVGCLLRKSRLSSIEN
jgi:hypothetical protein